MLCKPRSPIEVALLNSRPLMPSDDHSMSIEFIIKSSRLLAVEISFGLKLQSVGPGIEFDKLRPKRMK